MMLAGLMVKRHIFRFVNAATGRYLGVELARHCDLYPWQIATQRDSFVTQPVELLPKETTCYLRPTNPRLIELKRRYSGFDPEVVTHGVWKEGVIGAPDLTHFRRDNQYVWQRGRDFNELSYALTYYSLKASPSTADILNRMDEDALFGVHLFQVDDHPVSRDLLDSVREIDFIRNHINLENPGTSILDIGAGYGRLVYRLSQVAPPNVRIYGTDAIAESTFLSEFYLRFRGAPHAAIVPLDEVEAFIKGASINLATNIHSFSECMPDAIEWWVRRLAAGGVANLLVIPNHVDQKTRRCLTTTGADMELIFERYGYKVRVREPRFKDPLVQSYGIAASLISLFELQ
jgi:putative sugar O-methyltransferase